LNDVTGVDFLHVKAQHATGVPAFNLRNVVNFSTHQCWPLPDMRLDRVDAKTF
jgi:hypothetical protein